MKHIFYIIVLLILIVIFGIMIKRHHYGEQSDSCLSVRKALLAQTPKSENTYIPQCTIFGNYISQQCNQNTGECFCVTHEGKPVVGTQTSGNQQPASCPLSWFYRYYRQLQ